MIEEYSNRVRPVGVLYVDVHAFTWSLEAGFEFLLFKRRPDVPLSGQWQTISGKLDIGERIVDGFVRQVEKKSGIAPVGLFKMSDVATFFDEYYDTVMLVPNAVALVPKDAVNIDDTLHVEYRWASAREALDLLEWPTQRHAIEQVVAVFEETDGAISLRSDQYQFSEIAILPKSK